MKKTLIVLLAALVVLAAILLKNRSDERSMQSDVPALDSTRKGEVTLFKVIKKPDTAVVEKKDGKWVVGKSAYPADTAKVAKILKYVFTLQTKERVSESSARAAEYGLDSSEAKHISMRDASGKFSADVVIGKTSGSDYSSTYWKWESKPSVYRTPGNFVWEIGSKEDEWKDRKLNAIQSKDIKFIETTWKDSTGAAYHFKLEAMTDTTWKMLEPQDSNWVKRTVAYEMASRFADLSIDEFVTEKDTNAAKAGVDSPMVWIKVGLKSGTNLELKGGKTFGGYVYAQHPTRKELIKLSTWRFESFKKKPFEILDAPPAKADTSKAAAAAAAPASPAALAGKLHSGMAVTPASPAAKPTTPSATPGKK